MMRNWFWIVWAAILIILSGVQFTSAAGRTKVYRTNHGYMTRQQIRQLPILERPNRPGHFYGNAVRRAHARRYGNVYRYCPGR